MSSILKSTPLLTSFKPKFFLKTSLITLATISFSSALLAANTQVEFETNRGNFKIELFDEQAPETVKNFLKYVDDGFYEGTIFHRLIKDFMLQGGGFTKELTKKETRKPVKNEAGEDLKNIHGSVAMARTSSPNSATSQFFINFADNPHLDYRKYNVGYAVFGQVAEDDMEFINSLNESPTGTISIYRNVPNDAIVINKVSRVKVEMPIATETEQAITEGNAEVLETNSQETSATQTDDSSNTENTATQ